MWQGMMMVWLAGAGVAAAEEPMAQKIEGAREAVRLAEVRVATQCGTSRPGVVEVVLPPSDPLGGRVQVAERVGVSAGCWAARAQRRLALRHWRQVRQEAEAAGLAVAAVHRRRARHREAGSVDHQVAGK